MRELLPEPIYDIPQLEAAQKTIEKWVELEIMVVPDTLIEWVWNEDVESLKRELTQEYKIRLN